MDIVAPRGRLAAAQLRRVAAESGIGPADPLGPVIEALAETSDAVSALPDDCARRFDNLDARLAALLNDAKAAAAGELAHTAGRALPAAVRELTFRQHRGMFLAAAAALVAALLIGAAGGYWFGWSDEATKYVQTPSELGVALTGPAAADWTTLIRLNDIRRAERTCAPQAGGVACSISLWVKPPPAQGN